MCVFVMVFGKTFYIQCSKGVRRFLRKANLKHKILK